MFDENLLLRNRIVKPYGRETDNGIWIPRAGPNVVKIEIRIMGPKGLKSHHFMNSLDSTIRFLHMQTIHV